MRIGHELITLYEKVSLPTAEGGRTVQWKELATVWASLTPCAVAYPLRKDGQERYEGKAFIAIVRDDPLIWKMDKMVWNKESYFLFQTPQRIGHNKLSLKVFSWETTNANAL